MEITLNNQHIKATISSLGAELKSLVNENTNVDYLWCGDPAHWSGQSPVLFPIIGSLNDGKILIGDKSYEMGNHGFARRSDFQCLASDPLSAHFMLNDNETTLKQYPYKFKLQLIYSLIGNAISIQYMVTNTGTKVMPFQLGTHPAFNCPMGMTKDLSDWYLTFEKKESLSRIGLKDNLLDLNDLSPWMDNTAHMPLNKEIFEAGAIVFKSVESSHVTLSSDKTPEKIIVSYNNFPDMGIWQPVNAPFLCIEPWFGHGDPVGFNGDIMEKIGMVHLNPGETYEAELRIRIS